jgi:quinoprotein glucose dehydrogenase
MLDDTAAVRARQWGPAEIQTARISQILARVLGLTLLKGPVYQTPTMGRRASCECGRDRQRAGGIAIVVATLVLGPGAGSSAPAAQASRSVWDGTYTEAQAERGKAAYEEQCAFCHLSDLRGQGFAPALVDDTFLQRWQDGDLGELFAILQATMPQDRPASLSDEQYADIVAYLLKSNRYPAGQVELPADAAVLKPVTFKRPSTSKP